MRDFPNVSNQGLFLKFNVLQAKKHLKKRAKHTFTVIIRSVHYTEAQALKLFGGFGLLFAVTSYLT